MKNALITIAGIALLSAALPAEADRKLDWDPDPTRRPARPGPVPIDFEKPTLIMEMNDGLGAGPIIWVEEGVMPQPGLPADTIADLDSLGCNGTYVESGWNPGWNDIYPGTYFFDTLIQDQTYFFREPGLGTSNPGPYSFSVRAQDEYGIAKIKVSLVERDVRSNRLFYVLDDGPTEFVNVVQSAAVATLNPIYRDRGKFSHWEKQLSFEPNVPSFLKGAEVH